MVLVIQIYRNLFNMDHRGRFNDFPNQEVSQRARWEARLLTISKNTRRRRAD